MQDGMNYSMHELNEFLKLEIVNPFIFIFTHNFCYSPILIGLNSFRAIRNIYFCTN